MTKGSRNFENIKHVKFLLILKRPKLEFFKINLKIIKMRKK
jgi:hypothetical protein